MESYCKQFPGQPEGSCQGNENVQRQQSELNVVLRISLHMRVIYVETSQFVKRYLSHVMMMYLLVFMSLCDHIIRGCAKTS